MHEAYIDICGLPTKIITWGKRVDENFAEDESKDIILMIPGNPGITRFYCKFLETIHNQLEYPIWVIGHAGHEVSPTHNTIPQLEGNERLYGLQGQILYKEAFIEKYVPKDARVHFIGHSIGAYMILQLLKIRSIQSRAVGNYLLFPTIENLADTSYGKMFMKTIPPSAWFLSILIWLFTLVPSVLRLLLFRFILTCACITAIDAETVLNLATLDVLKKVLALGIDEMELVKKRDDQVLEENKAKIKLYYGANDGWAPTTYCLKLREDIPTIDAEISSHNIEHGFIAKDSQKMGNLVAQWIKN